MRGTDFIQNYDADPRIQCDTGFRFEPKIDLLNKFNSSDLTTRFDPRFTAKRRQRRRRDLENSKRLAYRTTSAVCRFCAQVSFSTEPRIDGQDRRVRKRQRRGLRLWIVTREPQTEEQHKKYNAETTRYSFGVVILMP